MPDALLSSPSSSAQTNAQSPRRRRGLRALSTLLIGTGLLALLEVGITLVWQEPFSALYAKFEQDHLRSALSGLERARPTPIERHRLARLPDERRRIAFLASRLQNRAQAGGPVGSIHIPRIGANFVVVDGTGVSELQKGPGIYPHTRFPGRGGTTAIAGHRTTYLAPFRHIDELRRGDRIVLDMPYARFRYTVLGHRVVAPTDVGAATDNVGYARLVLSACTPLFSAAQRILVYARLSSVTPVGSARTSLASSTRPAPGTPRAITSDARSRAAREALRPRAA